ncbi:MAG: hypothetical protein PHV17_00045 [Candidatus Omnitrophica bacterium]|nr:hypothetical protein [Candidatus Omnitrophota bacterium]
MQIFLFIMVGGALVVTIFLCSLYLFNSSGEAKEVDDVLAREKKSLEQMSYAQLEALTKERIEEPLTYGRCTFKKIVEGGTIDHGGSRHLEVRLTIKGTKNKGLDESVVIKKSKEL